LCQQLSNILAGSTIPDKDESTFALPNIEKLIHRMQMSGRIQASLDLLSELATMRPTFTSEALPNLPTNIRLSGGTADHLLLCFPSLVSAGGPAEYSKLGAVFEGNQMAYALPEPGFREGELLPLDLNALITQQVAAVRTHVGHQQILLCGHSSGGLVAHATAQQLEKDGITVTGLILLDSFWPDQQFLDETMPHILHLLAVKQEASKMENIGMTRLTAMGGYLRIFAGWEPSSILAPTLHIAAEETSGIPKSSWTLPHTTMSVPGNHFTMLDEHAPMVGHAISGWIQTLDVITNPVMAQ
jgi:surfactin synthase thioesterase subunit